MRSVFLILLVLPVVLFGQLPNAGFENWSGGNCTALSGTYNYEDPDSWGTMNILTCIDSAFTIIKTTDAHSGTYALKLTTININATAKPGICATGSINQSTQQIDGGFAVATRPSMLKGWFKYVPSGADQFSVSVEFYTGAAISANVVGSGSFSTTDTVNDYTLFSVPITYVSPASVDSARITILCSYSAQNAAGVGSTATIDDLFFVDCSTLQDSTTSIKPICAQSNGSARIIPTGGTTPYTFVWSDSSTTDSIYAVPAGSYTVTVQDANGCTIVDSVVLVQNNMGLHILMDSSNTTCGANTNTGRMIVYVTGGTDPYFYNWYNLNYPASNYLMNLEAGSYLLTVTDANGCSASAIGNVLSDPGPFATDSVTNIRCSGFNTGAITLHGIVGSNNYYHWSNGQTTQNLANLYAGHYSVFITDASTCTFSLSVNITQPAIWFSVTNQIVNEPCYGDSVGLIRVRGIGGNPPYTYQWGDHSTLNAIIHLFPGVYNVTITDSNNCSFHLIDTLKQPDPLNLELNVVDATSIGNDGSISAVVTGGNGFYVYSWNTDSTDTLNNITHLSPATYCVTVTDARYCSVTLCDSVVMLRSSGIATEIPESAIKIYPNPASDVLVIASDNADNKYHLTIYDMSGKAVTEKIITGIKTTIDLKQLAEGLYSYQFRNLLTGKTDSGKLQILR